MAKRNISQSEYESIRAYESILKPMNAKELEKDKESNTLMKNYEAFKSGKMTEDEWATYFCRRLYYFCVDEMFRLGRTNGSSLDDLMQECMYVVAQNAKDYNPEYSPTTFIASRIRGGSKQAVVSGPTQHFIAIYTKIENAVKKYYGARLEDLNLSLQEIVTITGLSPKQVASTLRQMSYKTCSFDPNVSCQAESTYYNPERAYVEKEQSEVVKSLLNNCTPAERFVAEALSGFYGPMNESSVVKEMSKPDVYNLFRDELGGRKPEPVLVKKLYRRALEKMRGSKEIRNHYSDWGDYEYVQIETNDLENAMQQIIAANEVVPLD